MPLTIGNTGAALIGGRAIPTEAMMTTRKVLVLRPFYFNREVQTQGTVVELPGVFASEMISAKKAEPYMEPPAPPSVAAKADDKLGTGKKEKSDAGK